MYKSPTVSTAGPADSRIAVLPAALADQIAAGEVVERPASIIKELVENAIDAGATRVEVELEQGGRELIRVLDDGRGIHPDDLELALTRHATSKLRTPAELIEIHTLGFRGEALASIAAVARIELRSRVPDAPVGRRARSVPGQRIELEPIGMPFGTQVEVAQLFANVPARRKFLRSEATEVGHCIDALVRVALVNPRVHVLLRHGRRELLNLPARDEGGRVAQVLERCGASGPLVHFASEREGIEVRGWFAPPEQAQRQRSGSFVVVRRRVIRDRTLAQVLRQAYGDRLDSSSHPLACLIVEPPRGTVDVNVHPQKSEVRFADAQRLFAVVRELVAEGLGEAPWWARAEVDELDESPSPSDRQSAWAAPRERGTSGALAGWSSRNVGWAEPRNDSPATSLGSSGAGSMKSLGAGGAWAAEEGEARRGYRLGTRAIGADYASAKQAVRGEIERLRSSLVDVRADVPPIDDAHAEQIAGLGEPQRQVEVDAGERAPELLRCLPGPTALFEDRGTLLVVDLRRLRAHLVRRRLLRELSSGPDATIPAQGLLDPVVVRRRADEHALLLRQLDALQRLGVDLEPFGDDAVLVRAVPAVLRKVIDDADIGDLLERLIPWLRMREQSSEANAADSREPIVDALTAMAETRASDPAARLARAWLAEAQREGSLDETPGVRRWTAAELLERR